jgi:transposase-like protein
MRHWNSTCEDAYKNLPRYCEDFETADPKTKTFVERTVENKFHRLFLCHGACAAGFAYYYPLLGLDGTHLKSKYKGILLAVTATGVNGQLFPLVYGIVSIENDDNWLWFLRPLHEIIQANASALLVQQDENDCLVFLSDRQKGLLEDVERVFSNSLHEFCMKHLEENFHKQFKNVELKKLLWKAARALTKEEFDAALENMKQRNPLIVSWLKRKFSQLG